MRQAHSNPVTTLRRPLIGGVDLDGKATHQPVGSKPPLWKAEQLRFVARNLEAFHCFEREAAPRAVAEAEYPRF